MQLHIQADGMKAKIIVVLLITILALNGINSLNYYDNCKAADVTPKLYVDDDYNSSTPGWQIDHFASIQDAINVSSAGDRIIVYAGTYSETITITHKLDLFGEDKTLTTITGSESGNRITITAANVNISHFKIKNCGNGINNAVININSGYTIITDNIIQNGRENGIYLNNCDNNIIYDNIITTNNANGIWLNNADDNYITYNTITNNRYDGIFLYTSLDNTIQNNDIKSNGYNGIFLNETCNDNIISNNNISINDQNGLFLNDHCNQNTISNNKVYSNSYSGFRLENSSSNIISSSVTNFNQDYGIMVVGLDNTIQSNTIKSNGDIGLFLFADDHNDIISNSISYNFYDGIRLSNSTNDTIKDNEISYNSRYGLYLDYFTLDNLIYNNFFHDNNDNALDKSLNRNRYNITQEPTTNIVGGSFKCGNYWDDFDEKSEGISDPDGDRISNTNCAINVASTDYGPLLDSTPPVIGTPELSSSTEVVGGKLQISVSVTDNIVLKNVYLVIKNPNNIISNFSILQNKTGNTYFCNQQYTKVGTYTFYIVAKDPMNWANTNNYTFYIDQGTAPTITDNSLKTATPSTTFVFNVTVIDDVDIPSQLTVKVNWYQGSNVNSGNYTMRHSGNNYFIIGADLDNSLSVVRYIIYAYDHLGNARKTEYKTITIEDNQAPTISVNRFGSSSDIYPNSFTFNATITDDNKVDNVEIEYWYEEGNNLTVEMDKKNNNYYEKTIVIAEKPSKLFCIIYATDPSGNKNDTKKPFSNVGGPYTGVVGVDLTFNGSNSFDLDGHISSYLWSFGDGTKGDGAIVNHRYSANGVYKVSLTVTDNNGLTNTKTTTATIIPLTKKTTSIQTVNEIENQYDIELDGLFYSYDTDGDAVVDKFIDPNNKLHAVHTGNIEIDGNINFLLSIDDSTIPEFLWDSTEDEIVPVTHIVGEAYQPILYKTDKTVLLNVSVNKTNGWIFLEVNDPILSNDYTISSLISVKKNNTMIDDDKIFRDNGKSYVLDDPDVNYQLTYNYEAPSLKSAVFSPSQGGLINEENKTITITYNIEVTVLYAVFYRTNELGNEIIWVKEIMDDLKTYDYKTYKYTPPPNLVNGMYYLEIDVKSDDGSMNSDSIYYNYESYEIEEERISFSFSSILILFGMIGLVGVALFLITRIKNISFDSFIYFKNKKILPFIKPLVIGPLRIDVNDKKVKKAEFYVDGKLKDTITQEPYIWNYNETSFMKKTIETKIYDQEGKSTSSGEMTFFVFNSPKLLK